MMKRILFDSGTELGILERIIPFGFSIPTGDPVPVLCPYCGREDKIFTCEGCGYSNWHFFGGYGEINDKRPV